MFESESKYRKVGRIESEREELLERMSLLKQERRRVLSQMRSIQQKWSILKEQKQLWKEGKVFQQYGIQNHLKLMNKEKRQLRRMQQKHEKNVADLHHQYILNKDKIQSLKQILLQKADQFNSHLL